MGVYLQRYRLRAVSWGNYKHCQIPCQVTRDAQWLQYSISYRIFAKIHTQLKIKCVDILHVSFFQTETITYLFWDCIYIYPLFGEFATWVKNTSPENVKPVAQESDVKSVISFETFSFWSFWLIYLYTTHLSCSLGDHCSDSFVNSVRLFIELRDPPYLSMYYIYFKLFVIYNKWQFSFNIRSSLILTLFAWMVSSWAIPW